MIIVLASVLVADDRISETLAASQSHVARSRLEPGCLEHGVSVDAEAPNRLVFVERWVSMEALKTHFAVPESGGFVKAFGELALEPPSMSIYEATEKPVGGRSTA